MSLTQVYVLLSTIMFIMMAYMLSGRNAAGLFLKIVSTLLAIFGCAVLFSLTGFVLANGMRLI